MAESIPVTDYKDLSKIFTKKPQNRDPARSKLRPIHALDTETYKGNIFLAYLARRFAKLLAQLLAVSCHYFYYDHYFADDALPILRQRFRLCRTA